MEEKGRFVLKCVLLLLICIVCGGILITAVNFLPVNRERKSASLAEIAEAVRAYLLELEPVGNDGKVFLWVTNQGRMPLAEYGEAVMGGEKLQGQMLSRIEYWCGSFHAYSVHSDISGNLHGGAVFLPECDGGGAV